MFSENGLAQGKADDNDGRGAVRGGGRRPLSPAGGDGWRGETEALGERRKKVSSDEKSPREELTGFSFLLVPKKRLELLLPNGN